jgi:DNA ligase-1
MTAFAEVAAASDVAASTRSRKAKVAAFAALLARLETDEVLPVVALLEGIPRQGRIGMGWRALSALEGAGATQAGLSVTEVDDTLTALEITTGPGSVAARAERLAELIRRATPAEADFLRRVMTGELRQGALGGLVTESVAAAAAVPLPLVRRAAMLAGDLPAVATLALRPGGRAALEAVGLTVGRAVQPMLAASAPDVASALELTGPASVEWKLDGIRLQVHRDGAHVALFTRNLNDVTAGLPGVVETVRGLPCRCAVLDGEVLAGQAHFFDVLHVDGEDLLDRTLVERLAALDRVAGASTVPRVATSDPGAAATFLDGALSAGHEGVMVKALDSTYEAGRRGGTWRKVKPVQTLDLVLAVEWGSGRRRGWLSNLHLGARSPESGGFVMVGKTFKGLTDDLLAWQTTELLAREVSREGHVVVVRPELVVEIALDGVLESTRYAGGVALRFARVRRYRSDKVADEADTISQVRALLSGRTTAVD